MAQKWDVAPLQLEPLQFEPHFFVILSFFLSDLRLDGCVPNKILQNFFEFQR